MNVEMQQPPQNRVAGDYLISGASNNATGTAVVRGMSLLTVTVEPASPVTATIFINANIGPILNWVNLATLSYTNNNISSGIQFDGPWNAIQAIVSGYSTGTVSIAYLGQN